MKRRFLLSAALSLLMFTPALAGPQHVEKAKRPLARGAQAAPVPQSSLADLAAKYHSEGQSAAVLMDVATGQVMEVGR